MPKITTVIIVLGLMNVGNVGRTAEGMFMPRELFRISFGQNRDTLAARIDGGNLLIPQDFTMDGTGHFYIYDTNNHRIARFSSEGRYELGLSYPATARQVFAHADDHQNLWLLVGDPVRGIYYGVYNTQGKSMRSGLFSRFDQFRLHLDDDSTLHVILSSSRDPMATQTFLLDEDSLLMKKEEIAPPPENHHVVRRNDHVYFIDQVPDASRTGAGHINHITDEAHRGVADIQGTVIYVTDLGEIYTRLSEREIDVYDVKGSLKGKVLLTGLSSARARIRFDSQGNLYELDGIPDAAGHYTAEMPGMRLMKWERR